MLMFDWGELNERSWFFVPFVSQTVSLFPPQSNSQQTVANAATLLSGSLLLLWKLGSRAILLWGQNRMCLQWATLHQIVPLANILSKIGKKRNVWEKIYWLLLL